jgi:chromosomal replication initiator protein
MKPFSSSKSTKNGAQRLFLNNAWDQLLSLSVNKLGKRVVDTWFRSLEFISWNSAEKVAKIQAPNEFVSKWVEKHYESDIKSILSRIMGYKSIKIELASSEKAFCKNSIMPAFLARDDKKAIVRRRKNAIERIKFFVTQKICKDFTFENFVEGPGNDIACTAAKYCIYHNESWYNPFLVYGPSGIGKSHLLQALAHKFCGAERIIIYQTADNFIKNYISAVKSGNIDAFEKTYEQIDILLIDDIQALAKKNQTQEIFLKILTSLQMQQKKVLLSSDVSPENINGLSERLKSRLEGGLVIDLSIPSHDTLVEIIKQKANAHNISLLDETVYYLASSVKSSIREAEGFLVKLATYKSITKKELSHDVVLSVISNGNNARLYDPFVHRIASLIKSRIGVSFQEMLSRSRKSDVVLARHVLMFLLRKHTKKSLKEICSLMQRKDHTIVIYANKKVSKIVDVNKKASDIVDFLEKKIECFTK